MDDERAAALVAALDDNRELTPAPPPLYLGPNQFAAIAREIATNVREIEDILKTHNITPEQYAAHIHPNGYFQQLLQSYAKEWESIKSTNKRLAFQAAAALEEKLPALAHRMGNPSENLNDVTSVAKLFTQLAGAGPGLGTASAEQGGERFAIQINIGRNTVEIETRKAPETREPSEPPRIQAPIPSDTEISRNTLEIQQLTEGLGEAPAERDLPEKQGI